MFLSLSLVSIDMLTTVFGLDCESVAKEKFHKVFPTRMSLSKVSLWELPFLKITTVNY